MICNACATELLQGMALEKSFQGLAHALLDRSELDHSETYQLETIIGIYTLLGTNSYPFLPMKLSKSRSNVKDCLDE